MGLRLRLFSFFFGLCLGYSALAQPIEWRLYDFRQLLVRWMQDQPLHSSLVLVGLDERSLEAGLNQDDLQEFAEYLRQQNCPLVFDCRELKLENDADGVLRKVDLSSLNGEERYAYPLFHFADTQAMLAGPGSIFRLAPIPLMDAARRVESLQGRKVVLGSYLQSAELVDHKTPTGTMTRLEIAGNLWDCLLKNQFWQPLGWPLDLLVNLSWAGIFLYGLSRLTPSGAILSFLLMSLIWMGANLGINLRGLNCHLVPALAASLFSLVLSLLSQWPRTTRLLQQFSTPEAEVGESEMREASILFTLLPDYLLQMERQDHHRAALLRREYAQMLGEICLPHQGLILDQQGDAQMVGFGTLHPRQAHALRAVATALDLCREVPKLLQRWGAPAEATHCGVCTGPVAWGEVGATRLKAAAAIGDTTNTAARLMGAARKLGRGVILSETTRSSAGVRIEALPLEPLRLKGKAEPVAVYEALEARVRRQPRRSLSQPGRSKIAPRLALFLACLATLGSWALAPLPILQWLLWDVPMIWPGPAPKIPPLIIAGIDESCQEVAPWPWPRALHAQVIENLEQAGVGGLFYDVLFDSAGPDPAQDQALARRISMSNFVLLAGAARNPGGVAQLQPPRFFPPLTAESLRDSHQVGLIHAHLGTDEGLLRSLPSLFRQLQPPYPSAALALAGRLQGQPLNYGPPLQIGSRPIPEQVMLRWQPPVGRKISYAQLLEPTSPALSQLHGSVVLVGDTLSGESDRFTTPVGPLKGVEIHARFLQTLMDPRPPADQRDHPGNLLIAASLSLALCLWGLQVRRFTSLLLLCLGALGLSLGLHLLALHLGLVLGLQTQTALLLASFGLLGSQALLAVSALRRFVPDRILAELIHQGEARDRVGEATIMVTDIRGYTSLSEKRSPVEILELLNQYHEETVACYERHGGSVLTYQGDAQLVVFGLLHRSPNPALAAVKAALELQKVVDTLRHRWNLAPDETFAVGAGLCTGLLTVGVLQAGQQQQYTVLGDSVRRAHKVQSRSDEIGRSVLLDERTYQLCGQTLEFEAVDDGLYAPKTERFCPQSEAKAER